MALKSTIFKAQVAVADIDHGYYADHALTLARHPSETDERMMVRLAALAFHAHELQTVCGGDGTLAFGMGLSNPDDPDVWLRDFTGRTRRWIEVGQPDDAAITKACRQADQVAVYAFHHAAEVWWKGIETKLTRLANLSVYRVPAEASQSLAALAQRSMQLQATLQEGVLMLGDGARSVDIEPVRWKGPAA
ncbi:YaeQ family protein [Ramlibacter pallidus]|uniref:YaeQ family protein n=1 Tax=Ramlibacter pallidus TaxID=2780087 RepID=A0ABR9S1P0_9BURK|nr:YaeQ family protein [Ramlibacter pallidus]MBE7367398.1 YaeQ family protein [Ramlibacter pallidus]